MFATRLSTAFLFISLTYPATDRLQAQEVRVVPTELSQMDVQRAVRQEIATEVRIAGSLAAIRRSTLSSRISSTIVELPVQIGDVVKAGDLLVRFDTEELASSVTARKAEIEALNAQTELARSVLDRNTALGERGASSEAVRLESRSNLLKLLAQLRSAQAELADAERSLAYAELRAEFDGVVASRSVDQGQTVAVNTELLSLVDPRRMEVDAGVPTSRIPLVRIGQHVDLSVEGFAGRTFNGEVVRVSPTAIKDSRAVRVFVAIDNSEMLLFGGMFTTGVLKVDPQKDVIALPTASIRHDAQGPFVLKVDAGLLVRQPVRLGTAWSDRDLVQVSGVEEGEAIVIAPLQDIAAGMTVGIEDR